VLAVGLLLAAIAPPARSQVPAPTPAPPTPAPPAPAPILPQTGASSAPAPFPTVEPGQIGTGTPPVDVFYVSPQGADAVAKAPTLPCLAANPCQTVAFALAQARDGDAISLAGGTYTVANPIEVDKLVQIGPYGFAPGSTTAPAQVLTTVNGTCPTPSAAGQTLLCTTSLTVQVFAGSTLSFTVSAPSGDLIQVVQPLLSPLTGPGTTTGCSLTTPASLPVPTTPASSATLLFTCPPGQTIAAGTVLSLSVLVTTSGLFVATPPTVTLTITPTTTSVRPVLESMGAPVFHVTAVGSAALHVTIFGLTIGNAFDLGDTAAIVLDNDSYTEIGKNVIGAQDLPNSIGILLSSSDHPSIHDNTIQGSTLFPRTATVTTGQNAGGYGIASAECLGSINHSNGVQLVNNLFAKNSNAGVWFCSNGTGGAFVSQNTMRTNGRGLVLLDAVDTYISGNIVADNVIDGIDVLSTSERNIITGNTIESQQSQIGAGILLAGNGALSPLGNQIADNQIRRNTADVVIAGAQGTKFTDNSITAVGSNTGVLFSLAIPGWSSGQPTNTYFGSNALQASGTCSATAGCILRLTAGVTAAIDATGQNDFGVSDPALIQSQIWDSGRDPSLGTVYVLASPPPPTPVGILGLPPPPPPPTVPAPGSAPSQPTPAPTPQTPFPPPGPTPSPTPAASTVTTTQATAYQDPLSNDYYYVVVSLTVNGGSAANDALTLNFFDAAGNALGTANVTTDAHGVYSGNVQPDGGNPSQPARIVITDGSGANLSMVVAPGNPLKTPPTGPVQ